MFIHGYIVLIAERITLLVADNRFRFHTLRIIYVFFHINIFFL